MSEEKTLGYGFQYVTVLKSRVVFESTINLA